MNDASLESSVRLESEVEHDVIFKDGDQQHDSKPGEHAKVLQDEVTKFTALVLLAVTMKHLWQLMRKYVRRGLTS